MTAGAKIVLILTLLSVNVAILWAECSVCSASSQMACVSENQYQACANNVPSGSVNTCPSGYICSTTTSVTCHSISSGIPASCSGCNVCDAKSVFACTGINSYALCLGTNVSSSSVPGNCGASLVCNINLPHICGDPQAGIAATCSPASNIETTAAPITLSEYAQQYCQTTNINGRFSLPANLDNTCKSYIYCSLTAAGSWSGQIYTCAGSTYFDDHSTYCVSTKPTGCQ